MARKKHELLTDEEREQLIGIPRDRDALARLYTFEPGDIAIIGTRRAKRNWLGAALQLALLRHPGISLAQLLQSGRDVPSELVTFVAEQLALSPALLADYASREQTMTDHARELASRLGLRNPVRDDIPLMIDAATKAAWATDKGTTIVAGVIAGLREAGILLPAMSTIERAGIAGRARARKRAAHVILASVSAGQLADLDGLFVPDAPDGSTRLTWLKTIPVAVKADHIRQILDRLRFVREIGISAEAASTVHPDRYRQFVREGRASASYMIERYATARRHATLVAFLIDIEERLTDAAVEMADKLIGSVFTRAKNAQARSFAVTARDVARLMSMFARTIDAVTQAVEEEIDPVAAIDAAVGYHNLLRVRPEVVGIASTAEVDPLILAGDKYATLRKFAPDLLEALTLQAGKGSARTMAAIELLRDLNRTGKRDLPPDPPMPFRKEWRKLVVGDDSKPNRRLWEIGVLAHLRNKLRSGDVWVERSAGYRRFDSYLLGETDAAPIAAGLGLPPTADAWLEERGRQLDWRLRKFAQRLKHGDLDGVRFDDGRLQISPVRSTVPPAAEALADRLDGMMPRIRIAELLHEVARSSGFLAAFTNLHTGEACPNDSALLATILADATNLGLARMAAASEGVTKGSLHNTSIHDVNETTCTEGCAGSVRYNDSSDIH